VAEHGTPLGLTFDGVAELYERARPGYPVGLFDDLAALAGLGPGASVVEVGCGTGKATRPLAERGYRVVGVEPGAAMADVARRVLKEYPNAEIVTAPFESWEPPDGGADLVFAATAWHWIDPTSRYRLAARALRPGGSLGVVTTSHVLPADGDRFFAAVQAVYEEIDETRGDDDVPLQPDAVPDPLSDEIRRSELFGPAVVRRHIWAQSYTTDEYLRLLDTYSNHIAMAPHKRAHLRAGIRRLLADRPDGRLTKHYLNWLHVARRVDGAR
jgi:SAM-dependent methyltransferase